MKLHNPRGGLEKTPRRIARTGTLLMALGVGALGLGNAGCAMERPGYWEERGGKPNGEAVVGGSVMALSDNPLLSLIGQTMVRSEVARAGRSQTNITINGQGHTADGNGSPTVQISTEPVSFVVNGTGYTHNIVVDGEPGVQLNVDFTIVNGAGRRFIVGGRFGHEGFASYTRLRSNDGKYESSDGHVLAEIGSFAPPSNSARYVEKTAIPYSQLHGVRVGKDTISFSWILWDMDRKELTEQKPSGGYYLRR